MPAGVVVGDAVRTAARHLLRSRIWGGAAGAVAALGSISLLADRAVYVAAPLVFLGVAAGTLVGEHTAPRPEPGTVRTAVLARRRLADVVPPVRLLMMRCTAAVAAGLAVAGILLAAPDHRSIAVECLDRAAAASPFPGFVYAGPALIVLAIGALVAETALRRATMRPTTETSAALSVDALLRTASGRSVTRASTAWSAVLATAIALPLASGLAKMDDTCPTPALETGAWGAWALALSGLLVLAGLAVDVGLDRGRPRLSGSEASQSRDPVRQP